MVYPFGISQGRMVLFHTTSEVTYYEIAFEAAQ
jgi:hypothetical protein